MEIPRQLHVATMAVKRPATTRLKKIKPIIKRHEIKSVA
jgi:hypothetical protein